MSSNQPEAISSLRVKSKGQIYGDRRNHIETRNDCFRDTADMKPFNELSMLFLYGQRHLTIRMGTFCSDLKGPILKWHFLGGIKSNASGERLYSSPTFELFPRGNAGSVAPYKRIILSYIYQYIENFLGENAPIHCVWLLSSENSGQCFVRVLFG